MYRAKKEIIENHSKFLNGIIKNNACFDPNFGVCYSPPSYSEQLTVTEELVDKTSGESFSIVRHVSDVHFILSENLSSYMDINTIRQISERLSKDRAKGLEGVDESVSFDAVTSRYLQRRSEIDEFSEYQDGLSKTYKDYHEYLDYVDKSKKEKKEAKKDEN